MSKFMDIVYKFIDAGMIDAIHNKEKTFYPYRWLSEHNLIDGFDLYDGATKGVVVFAEEDYVIKFDSDRNNSYCRRELENYEAAVAAGLSQYFPKTTFLYEIDGIVFILQEKCWCNEDEVFDSIYNTIKTRYEDCGDEVGDEVIWDEVYEVDTDAVEYLISDFELFDFITERRINDLHTANFGMRDGHYVIIDFSGYGSGVWRV